MISRYLTEAIESGHMSERFNDRIMSMPSHAIQNKIKRQIIKNLKRVKSHTFDHKSYGIRIAALKINKDSSMYYGNKTGDYYRIDDFLGKDSTGDEIWCVVRDNRIVSIMLRKSIQPLEKLRVDVIIDDTKDITKKSNRII